MALIDCLKQLGTGNNPTCMKCKAAHPDLTNALGPWFSCDTANIGNNIVFVGKIARGDEMGQLVSPNLEDVSAFGTDFIMTSSWAYWAYTRDIMSRVYGSAEKALPHCTFTNMVKCNNSSTPDTSTDAQRNFCISENRFILQELNNIKPKAVVFYTGTEYDQYIDLLMPNGAASFVDEVNERVKIGAKYMPWWSRRFLDTNGKTVAHFLRIGHPERLKKEPYVKKVADWITLALDVN